MLDWLYALPLFICRVIIHEIQIYLVLEILPYTERVINYSYADGVLVMLESDLTCKRGLECVE